MEPALGLVEATARDNERRHSNIPLAREREYGRRNTMPRFDGRGHMGEKATRSFDRLRVVGKRPRFGRTNERPRCPFALSASGSDSAKRPPAVKPERPETRGERPDQTARPHQPQGESRSSRGRAWPSREKPLAPLAPPSLLLSLVCCLSVSCLCLAVVCFRWPRPSPWRKGGTVQ